MCSPVTEILSATMDKKMCFVEIKTRKIDIKAIAENGPGIFIYNTKMNDLNSQKNSIHFVNTMKTHFDECKFRIPVGF